MSTLAGAIQSSHNPMFDLDDDLRWILGRPGFTVREIAAILRHTEYQCARKVEDEQAVAIHWMLTMYLRHGSNWRVEGDKELREIRDKVVLAEVMAEKPT